MRCFRRLWDKLTGRRQVRVERHTYQSIEEAPVDVQEIFREMAASMEMFGEALTPQTVQAPEPIAAAMPSGRQVIRSGWARPFPKDAASAPWEDLHEFGGRRPRRDPYAGLIGDPPVSMICPGCDLEQAPMLQVDRACGYCGLRLKLHGSRVFWWRMPVSVPEWSPRP